MKTKRLVVIIGFVCLLLSIAFCIKANAECVTEGTATSCGPYDIVVPPEPIRCWYFINDGEITDLICGDEDSTEAQEGIGIKVSYDTIDDVQIYHNTLYDASAAEISDLTVTVANQATVDTLYYASAAEIGEYLSVTDADNVIGYSELDYSLISLTKENGEEVELDINNCLDGQVLTFNKNKITCENTPKIHKEANMWKLSNILIVAVIAFVIFKIAPWITLRRCFKAFIGLVLKPFRRSKESVKQEWDIAKTEEGE